MGDRYVEAIQAMKRTAASGCVLLAVLTGAVVVVRAALSGSALPGPRPEDVVARVGNVNILRSDITPDTDAVVTLFVIERGGRTPSLPADAAAMDALKLHHCRVYFGILVWRLMTDLEARRLGVKVTDSDLVASQRAWNEGADVRPAIEHELAQDRLLSVALSDVYDRGGSPDDVWKAKLKDSMDRGHWQIALRCYRTPQSRERLKRLAFEPMQYNLPASAMRGGEGEKRDKRLKLYWAIDAELGKTDPAVAKYAAAEKGVWPKMLHRSRLVKPARVESAEEKWWQREFQTCVTISDPALKSCFPDLGGQVPSRQSSPGAVAAGTRPTKAR